MHLAHESRHQLRDSWDDSTITRYAQTQANAMPPKTSHHLWLTSLQPRDLSFFQPTDPLQNSSFVQTVVGIGSAGVLLLVIIGVLLCFYRDSRPFSTCWGKRPSGKLKRKPKKPSAQVANTPMAGLSATSEEQLIQYPPHGLLVDRLQWGV